MLRGRDVEELNELHRQGMTIQAISELTGWDRKTIRKYLQQPGRVPEYGPRPRLASKLDPFKPYLEERLRAGVWNARGGGYSTGTMGNFQPELTQKVLRDSCYLKVRVRRFAFCAFFTLFVRPAEEVKEVEELEEAGLAAPRRRDGGDSGSSNATNPPARRRAVHCSGDRC